MQEAQQAAAQAQQAAAQALQWAIESHAPAHVRPSLRPSVQLAPPLPSLARTPLCSGAPLVLSARHVASRHATQVLRTYQDALGGQGYRRQLGGIAKDATDKSCYASACPAPLGASCRALFSHKSRLS